MQPGEAEDFVTAYQAALPRMLVLARGLTGNLQDAEDVVQDAAATAYTHRDRYQPGTNFGAWLAAYVRNQSLNKRRHQRRRRAADLQAVTEPVAPPKPPGTLQTPQPDQAMQPIRANEQAEFDDAVCEALNTLKPPARACLLLRVVHEMEYREIAELMGVPEGTAMSHVHRARKLMRQALYGPTMGANPS